MEGMIEVAVGGDENQGHVPTETESDISAVENTIAVQRIVQTWKCQKKTRQNRCKNKKTRTLN